MKKQGFRGLLVCALAAVMGSAAAQSATLTGINWYTLDSAGHYSGGYANTYGGDTYSRNLYVTENQQVGSGPLLNSQNLTTLPTRVQIDVSTTGTYTFQMYCNDESTATHPNWGLNLFFNNDDLHPGISVSNVVNVAGFQVISPVGTPTLDPFSMGTVQNAAGSGTQGLVTVGSTQIQLLSYSTWSTNHYNVDRVDNFSDDGGFGNGTKDDVIEFSIHATTVPEPASILILGAPVLAAILRKRRSRS